MQTSDDPRWIRSREAILSAARALMIRHGPPGVTHRQVAELAGVGLATVYRHWPQSDSLLLAAMSSVSLPFYRDPVMPVRDWLRGQLRHVADEFAMPKVIAAASILMDKDPLMVKRRETMLATITERLRVALALAVAEGELETTIDPRDVVTMLNGPILFRTNSQGGTVSDELIERLIDGIGDWRD